MSSVVGSDAVSGRAAHNVFSYEHITTHTFLHRRLTAQWNEQCLAEGRKDVKWKHVMSRRWHLHIKLNLLQLLAAEVSFLIKFIQRSIQGCISLSTAFLTFIQLTHLFNSQKGREGRYWRGANILCQSRSRWISKFWVISPPLWMDRAPKWQQCWQ